MDWKDIIDFLKGDLDLDLVEYFRNLITQLIIEFFAHQLTQVYTLINDAVTALIMTGTTTSGLKEDLFDYTFVLNFMQSISGTLLIFLVALEAINMQTEGNTNIFSLVKKAIVGGFFIYFAPTKMIDILMIINRSIIYTFKNLMGLKIMNEDKDVLRLGSMILGQSFLTIIVALILIIAFIILCYHAAVRYIELTICILVAPIMAALYVKNSDYLGQWFKNTCAIVFTQSIHAFILFLAIKITMEDGFGLAQLISFKDGAASVKFLAFIGLIVVGIRGPVMLKQFLFTSGGGTGVFSMVVAGGRMAMLRKAIRR